MKIIKFLISFLAIFAFLVFAYGYLSENEVIDGLVSYYSKTPTALKNNAYTKDITIDFVQKTDDFSAKNRQGIINIYYTVLLSGMNEFTFYCNPSYPSCMKDLLEINNNSALLSQMNNFVNVFNTFRSIKTTYTNSGKITINIEKVYSESDINNINTKVDSIYNKLVDENKSVDYNIKKVHDYIIDNTKYDVAEENSTEFNDSSTAMGVLFKKLATCNGYTDTMSIFLDRMKVTNARVSNTNHIWNIVNIDGNWLHLDLTWDDPVNNLNKDMLLYDYYLKPTKELKAIDKLKDKDDHEFDSTIYNLLQ